MSASLSPLRVRYALPGDEDRVRLEVLDEVSTAVRSADGDGDGWAWEVRTSLCLVPPLDVSGLFECWVPDEFRVVVESSDPYSGFTERSSYRFVLLPEGLSPVQLELYRVLRADGTPRSRAFELASTTCAAPAPPP